MPDRRLAAILAADVVGYSALMAEDEAGTLEALRRLRRELFHPAVAGHRGKVVKAMGDGWLVEFASAVDAVNCAIRVQQGLEANPKISVRVGIHIGDVTHEDEDIFGDGVNVAARLEAFADPGVIAVSDAVYGTLDGTLMPSFDDAGEQSLKNIPRPVRVWIRGDQTPSDSQQMVPGGDPEHPASWPVLAIRPVVTSDARPDVRELAAALTSDLRNYLDKSRWLSAMVAETPPYGAFVLSCTLRARGDRLRLEAELTLDGGDTLWSHRIDGDLSDSFDWQDSAGADIASRAMGVISGRQIRLVAAVPDDAMDAETALLAAVLDSSMNINGAAAKFARIERAIAARPDWAQPYTFGAWALFAFLLLGYEEELRLYRDRLPVWVERAESLLPAESPYQFCVAVVRHWLSPEPDRLRALRDAVLRRSPYHHDALVAAYVSALLLGEPEDVHSFTDRILTFLADSAAAASPLQVKATACVMLGRDEEALEYTAKVTALSPSYLAPRTVRAAALAHLGRLDEAAELVAMYLRLRPDGSVRELRERLRYAETPAVLRYYDGLRLAGLPEGDE